MALFIRLGMWGALAVSGAAQASAFEFPANLPGFTSRPGMASFRPDGPMEQMLKEKDVECPNVGIYEYSDGQAASTGLSDWLAQRHLEANEKERSATTSVWFAQTEELILIGAWMAPTTDQAGRLEMCAATTLDDERASAAASPHLRVPIWLILGVLGVVGTLGSRMGDLTNRLFGKQRSSQSER